MLEGLSGEANAEPMDADPDSEPAVDVDIPPDLTDLGRLSFANANGLTGRVLGAQGLWGP